MKAYYPVLLDLEGKICLVVGGGAVAERRVRGLLESGAVVRVVSPDLTESLAQWHEEERIHWREGSYEPADLHDARLVIAATDRTDTNRIVQEDAQRLGVFVNRADFGEEGDAVIPATVRRGRLYVSVSTTGASPALASKLAEELEERFLEEYALYIDFLSECRAWAKANVRDASLRRGLLQELLQKDMLEAIKSGRYAQKRHEILQWLKNRSKQDNPEK